MKDDGTDSAALQKCPTGIDGLDEITGGGLPAGRATLVCGGPGCGKTVFAMEFLVRGATEHGEPGVFLSFEENRDDLVANFRSMGFDLEALCEEGTLAVEHVAIAAAEIVETGNFSLEPLFLRLETAIQRTGARRVAVDTVETIFARLEREALLRTEIKRLFSWLAERKISGVITAERGAASLTRRGLEEYVSDCVILLDHRVADQVSRRRLRVIKYRGAAHGADEYPFILGNRGFSVLPITSLGLQHTASRERFSSGVPDLDAMMGGEGFYRGSSILVSGTAGTGKSSLAAHFVDAVCTRGEKCAYISFEESVSQIARNMGSIGIDLQRWVAAGLLAFRTERSFATGLEEHLAAVSDFVNRERPRAVVIDPVTNLVNIGTANEIRAMLTRLIDFLKMHDITAMFTSLTAADERFEQTATTISSLMDTWIIMRDCDYRNEKKRLLYLLKARGMAHSRAIREMAITDTGIVLRDPSFVVYPPRAETGAGGTRK